MNPRLYRRVHARVQSALILAAAIATAGSAGAHAISHRLVDGGAGMRAGYDNGEPAAWCEARVMAPGEEEPFLETTTDRNGVVLFAPDRDGEWKVEIDDGLGHRIEARVRVTDGAVRMAAAPPGVPRLHGALAGLGLIFGIFGVWALIRTRSRAGHEAR